MEGGQARLFCLAMQSPACRAAENNRDGPLQVGNRDAVVLRSHQIHRGRVGCAEMQSGEEPEHGSLLIGRILRNANGNTIVGNVPIRHDGPARPDPTTPPPTPRPHPRSATAGVDVLRTISSDGAACIPTHVAKPSSRRIVRRRLWAGSGRLRRLHPHLEPPEALLAVLPVHEPVAEAAASRVRPGAAGGK